MLPSTWQGLYLAACSGQLHLDAVNLETVKFLNLTTMPALPNHLLLKHVHILTLILVDTY